MQEYVYFDWTSYLNYYEDLRKIGIDSKVKAWNHWINKGVTEGRMFFDTREIKNFDWMTYVNNYKDLQLCKINSPERAYEHWIRYGKKQERTYLHYNTSKTNVFGFGNLFFVNMACHFIAKKYNLNFEYKYYHLFQKLGVDLYVGANKYSQNLLLSDTNFYELIKGDDKNKKNILAPSDLKCRFKKFTLYLKDYFKENDNKNSIIQANLYKERYVNNNDLFIHVRLGKNNCKKQYNLFDYYDEVIKNITYENIYISSDYIQDEICKTLISKYKMKVIEKDPVETIMFGSTCKHIILSGGSFSWLIGFFAFFTKNIYYPSNKSTFHSNIHVFKKWNGIGFFNTYYYKIKKHVADDPTEEWYDLPFDLSKIVSNVYKKGQYIKVKTAA